jgi:hypothetical protein
VLEQHQVFHVNIIGYALWMAKVITFVKYVSYNIRVRVYVYVYVCVCV